jgi:hypothetical protein
MRRTSEAERKEIYAACSAGMTDASRGTSQIIHCTEFASNQDDNWAVYSTELNTMALSSDSALFILPIQVPLQPVSRATACSPS